MNTIERIFKLMKENNINAAQLTREIPLTNGLITQWKQGKQKPSLEALNKISKYFNVSLDYLVNGKELTQSTQADTYNNLETPEKTILLKIYNSLDEKKQHIVLQKALELANEDNS